MSLLAMPAGGSSFAGWSGACAGTGACTVTGTASVTAAFAPPQTIAVSIAPATAALATGGRQQFTATVTGSADTGVLWSVQEGAPGGSVDGTGLYTAPSSAGTYHVLATSHADPSRSATATVTVTNPYDLPPRLSMAAFDSTLFVPELSLDVNGRGSSRIGQISLRGSEGSIEVDGRSLSVIAFERQPFAPPWQIIAYELIAVAPDRYYLMWLYCRPGTPDLFEAWVESTSAATLLPEVASGSCIDKPGPSNPLLRAPAVSMDWPTPVRGYSVSGPDVNLPDGAPGTVQYEGVRQVVISFVSVDCSFCGSPGWYELHSVLWNPATSAVSLGIFYLFPGVNVVNLTYTLSMPVLARGPNISYPATWSKTTSTTQRAIDLAEPRLIARPLPPSDAVRLR